MGTSHFNRNAALTAVVLAACAAQGQSADDALINKLVQKGILTAQEAGELRNESKKDFDTAFRSKAAMPSWVEHMNFGGDFRGRYDGIYAENPLSANRDRLRYRLRIGITANLLDDFEIGFRLQSGEPVGSFGGNPLSSNTTFQDNGSKKYIGVGLAYAKWSPLHTEDWSGSVTFGKMENPLEFPSSLVFSKDYLPEGLAAQSAYKLNPHQTLKFNATGFVLDELASSSHDPWLGAAQLRLDSSWGKNISSSIGVTALGIINEENLVNDGVPNVNRGNTRNAKGAPAYGFNPIHADATLTYSFAHAPAYSGKFPVSVGGEFMVNPSAPAKNEAWSAGFSLGKSGKKSQWALNYRWIEAQADVWYEEVMDLDFAAYYQQQQPNAGCASATNLSGEGLTGGTNIRGHILKADYSLTDSLTLSVAWYMTALIDASPTGSQSAINRVQVDLLWRF